VTINSLTIGFPIPARVASVDSVTFAGGNLKGSSKTAADKSSVSVTFTGPMAIDAIQMPTAQLHVTLKPGTEAVSWPGPTGIDSDVVGLGAQSCTAVPGNPPMQTTAIVGGTPGNPKATTPGGATPVPAAPKFTG
jgi:hypothetical protein